MAEELSFKEYQIKSRETAIYEDEVYPYLGLSGEVGELLNKYKKILRDGNNIITDEFINDASYELGDILWYLAQIASDLDLSLDKIAKNNIKKLQDRKARGKLKGSGDNR